MDLALRPNALKLGRVLGSKMAKTAEMFDRTSQGRWNELVDVHIQALHLANNMSLEVRRGLIKPILICTVTNSLLNCRQLLTESYSSVSDVCNFRTLNYVV